MKENKENSKSVDQSKLEVQEVDNQKYNGFSVGGLLSQLRSEDAVKQRKFKIQNVKRNARTNNDVLSQPPEDALIEESCRKDAEVTEDEHRAGMKGLERQQMIASPRVQLSKDVSRQEDSHSNLPETCNMSKAVFIIQEEDEPSECNLKQAVVEVPHPKTHSQVAHMVEMDLHSPMAKSKVAQMDSLTMNFGPVSLNSAVETKETGSVASEEVQYECGRLGVGAPVNDWKATKKVLDFIEDSKIWITGDETVKVENDQPLEKKDEKSDKNYTTMLDDSSHDLCRNTELHLQDNKLLTLEKDMEVDGQCGSDTYVNECSQERGDGAVEAEMGRCFHPSPFPRSTEYTLEMPTDDPNPEGERAEEPGRDGADESKEWNDKSLQESDSSSGDLTRECPEEDVIQPSSLQKSQRLCIPDEVGGSCLKVNFDPEQEERSLHEVGDDLKMPDSSGLETNQRGDGLGMQDMKPEEQSSGNGSDGVPTSYVHREVEKRSSTENGVESEEAAAIDQTRKPIFRECNLQPNAALGVSRGPDTADTERGDLSLPSDGSESINEEVITPVCQDSDLSMDSSLMGLSDALDLEFGSNSPSPIMMNDLNLRMSSFGSTDYAFNMKAEESINPSLMDTCDGVERDVTKDPDSLVDDDSSRISRSASPFAEGNKSAKEPTSDHIQGVFTFEEREALAEDFNHPSSELPREGDDGQVTDQSEAMVSEFDVLVSHETHQDVEEGTLQETFLKDLVSDQDSGALVVDAEEEPLSTSSPAEELTENDDALSLACDAEELMRNLDDLLQDEGLQLNEQR